MSLKSNYEYIRDWCNHKFLTKDEQISVDLSDYYTKSEVDSAITDATEDIDLSDYVTNSELTTGLSTKQNTISDLSTIRSNAAAGAAKVSNVQSDWNATSGLARILNKPDLDDYLTIEDYTQDEEVVAAALNDLNSNKQATLVSGTNIKTVNGTSLLGSGDLVTKYVAEISVTGTSQSDGSISYSTTVISGTFADISAAITAEKDVYLKASSSSSQYVWLRFSGLWTNNEIYFVGYGDDFLRQIYGAVWSGSNSVTFSATGSFAGVLMDENSTGNAITNITMGYSFGMPVATATKGATFALASDLPTKTSDLTNDSGFQSLAYTAISSASSTTALVWKTMYQWTVNPTSITLTLPSAPSDPRGEIVLKFTTGSTAPTMTWPSTLKWANGEELTVEASTTYEFSIGYDMMGGWTIVGCGFSAAS